MATIFDGHSDLLYDVTRRRLAGESRVLERRHLDRLRRGGIEGLVLALWYGRGQGQTFGDGVPGAERAAHRLEVMLSCAQAEFAECPWLAVVRTAEEAEAARAEGKLYAFLAIEGMEGLEGPEELDRLASLGLTVLHTPEEAEPGDSVLLRAHGEGRAVYEALERRGATVVDATCPRVAKVHQIVAAAEKEGRQPVMIGDPNHPEVRGVGGWCRSLQVFSGPEEVLAWAESLANTGDLPLSVVSQTTLRREIWESSLKILKKRCTNLKIFDTICDATHTRQSEAALLAARVDAMVVVGDPQSANTKHLTEICRLHCSRVFQIESADELPWAELSDLEIERGGASYTIDTLRQLTAPDRHLFLIIGTDMLLSFDRVWRSAGEICRLCTLAAYARDADEQQQAEKSRGKS